MRIFPRSSLSPNRSVRYESVSFQKNSVAENTRYRPLNKTPAKLVVRGGGKSRYSNEVVKNQTSVGTSVYPQATASPRNVPFPPTIPPITQVTPTTPMYVTPTAAPNTTNSRLSRNGRDPAVL